MQKSESVYRQKTPRKVREYLQNHENRACTLKEYVLY